MSRIRFLPGALLCYGLSYVALITLAVHKDLDWNGFSFLVWLFSALLIFVGCAAVPLVIRMVVKLRTGTFVLLWAATIAAFGAGLFLSAN